MGHDQNRIADLKDNLAAIVDGEASALSDFEDVLAESDYARDLRHDAESAASEVALAGSDYQSPDDMERRVLAAIDAESPYAPKDEDEAPQLSAVEPADRSSDKAPGTATGTQPKASSGLADADRASTERRPKALFAVIGLAAAAAALFAIVGEGDLQGTGNTGAVGVRLQAEVMQVARAATSGAPVIQVQAPGRDSFVNLGPGGMVENGSVIRTDSRTRAELRLSDGSTVTLNHSTELELPDDARMLRLARGELVAEVAHLEEGPQARYATDHGVVEVLGTKFVLVATESEANVRVTRGLVQVTSAGVAEAAQVRVGEEGVMTASRMPVVTPFAGLARAVEWSEIGNVAGDDLPTSGLGELRARRPGESEDRERPLELSHHRVSVRIAGNVARTEVQETFTNESPHTLEGIYRFPMPADARISSLQLEVDGQWEEGAFVERDRAQKIWRGVIRNATPQRRRVRNEEIIWVPGPWRDPALLEWQRGGRFELRIFPIPGNGSRRVRLSYEQTIQPHGDMRRYVYSLPHAEDDSLKVGTFEADIRVAGATESHDLQSRSGYAMENQASGDRARSLTMRETDFVPAGDIIVDYRRAHAEADLSYWTFDGQATVPPVENSRNPNRDVIRTQGQVHADDRAYVAFALRPELPRFASTTARDFIIVVDSSQSMVGERFERASRLAVGLISEMDRRDRFVLMACDLQCESLTEATQAPSSAVSEQAAAWLAGIEPAGASYFTSAIREAAGAVPRDGTRERHVLYLGDGLASMGHRLAGSLAAEVEALEEPGLQVSTVGIGQDADSMALAAAARAGGGQYIPFVPGQRTASAALAVLETTYGATLVDARVTMPAGIEDVQPRELPNLRAGQELILVGRVRRGAEVRGELRLEGRVANEAFENQYPVALELSTSSGNAFVPRLWAAKTIEALELAGRGSDRSRIVALSKAYGVMSRETSLLVLESEAMFRAFGVDRARPALQWTGEEEMDEQSSEGRLGVAQGQLDLAGASAETIGAGPAPRASSRSAVSGLSSRGSGVGGGGNSASMRAAAEAPARRAEARPVRPQREEGRIFGLPPNRGRQMIPMRRVWFLQGQISRQTDARAREERAVREAEERVHENPNSRDRLRELVRALSRAGRLERAQQEAEKWVSRDRLDPEALTYLADVVGRQGQQQRALRLLSGVVDLQSENVTLHRRLAGAYSRSGQDELACAHWVSLAELDADDEVVLGRAVGCERVAGRDDAANRVLARISDAGLRARVAGEDPSEFLTQVERENSRRGQLLADASWSGGGDLDISLITPQGTRLSWMGGRTSVLGDNGRSDDEERVGLRRVTPGSYVVEIARASAEDMRPVSGVVRLRVMGETRSLPFTLTGERMVLGRATVTRQSRLVPVRGGRGSFPGAGGVPRRR